MMHVESDWYAVNTKIHGVFNVNFQYDIVKMLEGKLFLKNIKGGIPRALLIENVRTFVVLFKGEA